ncbi:MAG: ABC transporter permease [Dactylosporangium sp.]|nr:hypothetical protein [Dactylosporangium sp.]NNJ61971.1 ABC transporter permease [Dactylosporangium sp.]
MRMLSRWGNDLLLGARLVFRGGPVSWLRLAFTALGVGTGAAMLLVIAAMPHVVDSRGERSAQRAPQLVVPGTATGDVSYKERDTEYRGQTVTGFVARVQGPDPSLPPGVSRLPEPGAMVVSPALRQLLASPEGELLRPRLPYRISGTIEDRGLLGPSELVYYAGVRQLAAYSGDTVAGFGGERSGYATDAVLLSMMTVAFVVILFPVIVYISAAVRAGGEDRDRRLSALRLIGSDVAMVRRMASAEALLGSALGVLLGWLVFWSVRGFVERIVIADLSVFAADLRPVTWLAGIVSVGIPVLALVVSLLAMRRVAIEPLEVVHQGTTTRRRLWWRLLLPALGMATILAMIMRARTGLVELAVGTCLILFGVSALLPWLVEALVRRGAAGSVSWQLAVRRLRLESGSASRAVSGISVVVAGMIAMNALLVSTEGNYVQDTGQNASKAQIVADRASGSVTPHDSQLARALRDTPGVVGVSEIFLTPIGNPDDGESGFESMMTVASCATLRELAELRQCADGDVFIATDGDRAIATDGDRASATPSLSPGDTVTLGGGNGPERRWTIPSSAATTIANLAPNGIRYTGVYLTPAASRRAMLDEFSSTILVRMDVSDRDAIERVRNTFSVVDPAVRAITISNTSENSMFRAIRRGMSIGVALVMLLIGASLLLAMVEQLRERGRVLAVLMAFGVRRVTLAKSILWQTMIPVVIGMVTAIVGGLFLGALLMRLIDRRIAFELVNVAEVTGMASGVVVAVTLLSLPVLLRYTRPSGLRSE